MRIILLAIAYFMTCVFSQLLEINTQEQPVEFTGQTPIFFTPATETSVGTNYTYSESEYSPTDDSTIQYDTTLEFGYQEGQTDNYIEFNLS